MEIHYAKKEFRAPDSCPIERPKMGVLERFIKVHGVEAFVTSEKFGKYAACLVEDLRDMGAEVVIETNSDTGTRPIADTEPLPAKSEDSNSQETDPHPEEFEESSP